MSVPVRLLSLFAAVSAAGLLTACGGGGDYAAAPGPIASPPPSAPTSASECFNPALFTAGTTYQLNYKETGFGFGVGSSSFSISGSVGAATSFNGVDGLTPVTETTTYGTSAPSPATRYVKFERSDILTYATEDTVGTSERKSIFSPPIRDQRFAMAPGASSTADFTVIYTFTPPSSDGPGTIPISMTTTYVGQEAVTVPA